MNDPLPSVAVIVINYNTPDLVSHFLESLKNYTTQVDYEVVVVNNGCQELGKYTAIGSTFVRTIESPENLGFAAAANRAACTSRQEFLLFANSDCQLNSNVIPRMIKYLVENEKVAACSPRLVSSDGKTHSSIRRFPTHKNLRGSRGAFLRTRNDYTIEADETRKAVEATAATFLLIRRSDHEALSGFDERFFMYVEDTDLCKRLIENGREVHYLGDLVVTHRWGASTIQHPWRMKYHHHLSIWKYFQKHYPDKRVANFWLALQLVANFLIVSVLLLVQGRRLKR